MLFVELNQTYTNISFFLMFCSLLKIIFCKKIFVFTRDKRLYQNCLSRTVLQWLVIQCTQLRNVQQYTVLYGIPLYITLLYFTVQHFTALHYTAMCCNLLNCSALYCTVLHCTALFCTVLHCSVLYCIAPNDYTQSNVFHILHLNPASLPKIKYEQKS